MRPVQPWVPKDAKEAIGNGIAGEALEIRSNQV
jgi:hypothetical protein